MGILTLTVKEGNGLLFTNKDGSKIVVKYNRRTAGQSYFHIKAGKDVYVQRLQNPQVLQEHMEKDDGEQL